MIEAALSRVRVRAHAEICREREGLSRSRFRDLISAGVGAPGLRITGAASGGKAVGQMLPLRRKAGVEALIFAVTTA